MKGINFSASVSDLANDAFSSAFSVTLRLKAVATGTANFEMGFAYGYNGTRGEFPFFEDGGDNSAFDYAVTVTDGSVTPEPNEYTVTFVGFDGAILDEQTVTEGDAAVAPEAPAVRGYTFTGWDVAFDNITADTTVTAIYEAETYTVYFQDKDGNVFAEETVAYGEAATAPEAPVVEGYTFTGWDVAFDAIYGDTYVTAQYEINKYTVTFVGFGGAVLDEQTVEHGAAAIAPEAPVVDGHTFNGWDKAFDNITGDLTVRAKYLENMPNIYTVNFVGFDGADLGSQDVVEGAAAVAPTAPAVEGYTFKGWDKAFDNVTGDLTVTAVYEINKYTVTFVVGAQGVADGQLVWTVDYNTASSAITVPTVTAASAAYAFAGWDKELPANITADITITAKFTTTGSAVNVTFVQGANGTILGTDDSGNPVVGDYTIAVSSGVAAGSAFETPDVVADDNYHFVGWFVGDELYDFNTILEGDITLTAKFELNAISFGDFELGTAGSTGIANAKLYLELNGEVPADATVVFFYQTGDGRTSITISDLTVSTDDNGAYIQMAIVPGSFASFDAYIVDGDIDFSAADWNVIDIITGVTLA